MNKQIQTQLAVGSVLVITIIIGIYLASSRNKETPISVVKPNESTNKEASAIKSQDQPARFVFQTNGKKNIYKEKRGDKWVIVIDGQESALYDSISNEILSPDGTQFVYSAYLNGQAFVVVNNVPHPRTYVEISQIAFSPNGEILAYVGDKGPTNVLVTNGTESKEYSKITSIQMADGSTTYIIFGPDNETIAYKVVDNTGTYMVIGDEEGKHYADITNFEFTDDGTYSYDATTEDDQQVIVINDQETVVDDEPEVTTPTEPVVPPIINTGTSTTITPPIDTSQNEDDDDEDDEEENFVPGDHCCVEDGVCN